MAYRERNGIERAPYLSPRDEAFNEALEFAKDRARMRSSVSDTAAFGRRGNLVTNNNIRPASIGKE